MCQREKRKFYSYGEDENGYWRTLGRVQRVGSVHVEFEVARGHSVENSCWTLEKSE